MDVVANLPLPLATIFTPTVVRWTVWSGLVLLTAALLLLMRTKWGHAHPLRKCIVLSLLVHSLIGIYATTVNIVTAGAGPGSAESGITAVSLGNLDGDAEESFGDDARSSETFGSASPDALAEEALAGPARPDTSDIPPPDRAIEPTTSENDLPAPSVTPRLAHADYQPVADVPAHSPARAQAAAIEQSAASSPHQDAASDVAANPPTDDSSDDVEMAGKRPGASGDDAAADPRTEIASSGKTAGQTVGSDATAGGTSRIKSLPADDRQAAGSAAGTGSGVPSIYKLREDPNRAGIVRSHGGNKDTEAAVRLALKWLDANQSDDGRWNPRQLEAGREIMINGHDRSGAGSRADTGITGLVLLAFLASGDTHLHGDYQETVQHGLEFLLGQQATDGSVAGNATLFERMYCHAMATYALSEAYGMTRDERLREPVRRAVAYSVNSQHLPSGGWRYEPGQPGDTSQLGWQVMALKSAELAGIEVPQSCKDGMVRFLQSVSYGKNGGLASYRPGHQVSRAMTAESLACRQFLGMARTNPASDEAGDYLLKELPGRGETNLYYWYYGTLSMYQLQGEHWNRWNEGLQASLLPTQRTSGQLAGSWDPDAVWGAYGGRAYSTALSALCLEVYYRFLPLQVDAAARDKRVK